MAIAFHLVARAHPTLVPLLDRNVCVDLWERLRGTFPKVAACVLMPNHLHLLYLAHRPGNAQWRLGVELRAWAQRFHPGSKIWTPIPDAIPIPDFHHLKRQIRYVHLNPCRSRLVSDPLAWEWSTHRDVTGCVLDPWPCLPTLAQVFETTPVRLGEKMHRYISADPAVQVSGTPMIRDPDPRQSLIANLDTVFRGCASVRRERLAYHRGASRDLAIQVAHRLGLRSDDQRPELNRRVWRRATTLEVNERAIQAVLRVLADSRCHPR